MFNADKHAHDGAELLDIKKPDWYRNVDKDKIAMYHPRNCVVGQVYGNYYRGIEHLGTRSCRDMGFYISWLDFFMFLSLRNPFRKLKKAWIREITNREEQAAQAA